MTDATRRQVREALEAADRALYEAGAQLSLNPDPKAQQACSDCVNAFQQTRAALAALAQPVKPNWICFHCGFESTDLKEAEAHFGERDDAEEFKPLCKWWQRMDEGERAETLQDTLQQISEERDENAVLRTRIEGLEYRVEVNEADLVNRFKGARTINDVWCQFDSMEGRALAAEEKLRALAQPADDPMARLEAWLKAVPVKRKISAGNATGNDTYICLDSGREYYMGSGPTLAAAIQDALGKAGA